MDRASGSRHRLNAGLYFDQVHALTVKEALCYHGKIRGANSSCERDLQVRHGHRNRGESSSGLLFGWGNADNPLAVPYDEGNGDGLTFPAGKSMDYIRERAMDGMILAHTGGGVRNIIIEVGGKTARDLGELIYFFEYACGLSGYLLDANPFGRPGVEAYKKNMLALLGKPGYEERREELESKLAKA